MNQHIEPLVSVVTPFYNTALYLDECIQSVINQSYANWEYIIVDNCSTDRSKEIAENYASVESRIRFINESVFLNQVDNYNRALRYISAKSDYCKVVQADDWIYKNCLSEMVAVAKKSKEIGLVSSFTLYGNFVGSGGLEINTGPVYNGRETARKCLLYNISLFGSPTNVLYKSDIVRRRDDFYPTTRRYFEDLDVCYEILKEYDFAFVPQVLSFTRRENESIWYGLETYEPSRLSDQMFLNLYGKEFLDNDEFNEVKKDSEELYYKFLANYLIRGRQIKNFWKFHSDGMKNIGKEISIRKTLIYVLRKILDLLFNPKNTIEKIWNRIPH